MKWFEYIFIALALLIVLNPLIIAAIKKKKHKPIHCCSGCDKGSCSKCKSLFDEYHKSCCCGKGSHS